MDPAYTRTSYFAARGYAARRTAVSALQRMRQELAQNNNPRSNEEDEEDEDEDYNTETASTESESASESESEEEEDPSNDSTDEDPAAPTGGVDMDVDAPTDEDLASD